MHEHPLIIPSSITESIEWKKLVLREEEIGIEKLLSEILDKKLFSNAEMIWIFKKMIYAYGKKDPELLKIPSERIFLNFIEILKSFYLFLDSSNPNVDNNTRSYLSAKITNATWGINKETRKYLKKI